MGQPNRGGLPGMNGLRRRRRSKLTLTWVLGALIPLLAAPTATASPRTPGDTDWVRLYTQPFNGLDVAESVAVSPDGSKVFVTGYSTGSGTNYSDYATVAYDASTGATAWARRYDGPTNSTD